MSSALASVAARRAGSVVYVSGEESAAQVRLRAERLGADALSVPVLAETSLETVLDALEAERPDVCVIDSVQTLHSEDLTGAPGSVGQVREVAARLERFARERRCAVILVGHVTKDGTLAGPRVLEHAVDCVLQFEGEPQRTYRTLRALKNRFGSTNEIGVFEMRSGGLTEVADPSERFVARGAGRCRARASCARWRARGRCWSRSRRWSRRPTWCRRAGSRTASTATGSAWCSPMLARHGGAVARARCGRVRERRRRRAHRGARRRPRGRAGGRLGRPRRAARPRRRRPLGLLRRGRPDRRAALRRPRRAPAARRRPGSASSR